MEARYHMNFLHGISALTGLPYEMPGTYREIVAKQSAGMGGDDRRFRIEALCERCGKWIYIGMRVRTCLHALGGRGRNVLVDRSRQASRR